MIVRLPLSQTLQISQNMTRIYFAFTLFLLILVSCENKEPRSLQIISPTDRPEITLRDSIYIEAFARGERHGIKFSLINERENRAYTFSSAPFYIHWSPHLDGDHLFQARAEYPDGMVLLSEKVLVRVKEYEGSIKIQGIDGPNIKVGLESVIYINIIHPIPVIDSVAFSLDGYLLQIDSVFPFALPYTFSVVGQKEIQATLYSNEGAQFQLHKKIEVTF